MPQESDYWRAHRVRRNRNLRTEVQGCFGIAYSRHRSLPDLSEAENTSANRLMTIQPVRLQISRHKGFDLQALSLATNGLPAVNCARPSKFGNRFRVGAPARLEILGFKVEEIGCLSVEDCVRLHRECWERMAEKDRRKLLAPLRGKNLACWCSLHGPCHVDVLLKLANR